MFAQAFKTGEAAFLGTKLMAERANPKAILGNDLHFPMFFETEQKSIKNFVKNNIYR